jgi:hypothetical protein
MRLNEFVQTESLSDVKSAWDTGVHKIKKIMNPATTAVAPEKKTVAKTSPFDSVDPIRMKELVKNVLAGKALTPPETQMLQDLYRKL